MKKIMILGASILQLPAIVKAKEMGLDKVRIVCRDINIGSNKTILANSGVYVDMIHGEVSGMNINRYDIPLS